MTVAAWTQAPALRHRYLLRPRRCRQQQHACCCFQSQISPFTRFSSVTKKAALIGGLLFLYVFSLFSGKAKDDE
jgi:hypothetical protein